MHLMNQTTIVVLFESLTLKYVCVQIKMQNKTRMCLEVFATYLI